MKYSSVKNFYGIIPLSTGYAPNPSPQIDIPLYPPTAKKSNHHYT
jgi:hypothetical protein